MSFISASLVILSGFFSLSGSIQIMWFPIDWVKSGEVIGNNKEFPLISRVLPFFALPNTARIDLDYLLSKEKHKEDDRKKYWQYHSQDREISIIKSDPVSHCFMSCFLSTLKSPNLLRIYFRKLFSNSRAKRCTGISPTCMRPSSKGEVSDRFKVCRVVTIQLCPVVFTISSVSGVKSRD